MNGMLGMLRMNGRFSQHIFSSIKQFDTYFYKFHDYDMNCSNFDHLLMIIVIFTTFTLVIVAYFMLEGVGIEDISVIQLY